MRKQKPPTPRQLAIAADTLKQFKLTAELSPQDHSIIEQAEHLIGMAAFVRMGAES